jgi:hypothetical protein
MRNLFICGIALSMLFFLSVAQGWGMTKGLPDSGKKLVIEDKVVKIPSKHEEIDYRGPKVVALEADLNDLRGDLETIVTIFIGSLGFIVLTTGIIASLIGWLSYLGHKRAKEEIDGIVTGIKGKVEETKKTAIEDVSGAAEIVLGELDTSLKAFNNDAISIANAKSKIIEQNFARHADEIKTSLERKNLIHFLNQYQVLIDLCISLGKKKEALLLQEESLRLVMDFTNCLQEYEVEVSNKISILKVFNISYLQICGYDPQRLDKYMELFMSVGQILKNNTAYNELGEEFLENVNSYMDRNKNNDNEDDK